MQLQLGFTNWLAPLWQRAKRPWRQPKVLPLASKISAFALLAAAAAFGQLAPAFHDIATTDDGAQTYFVSELRQKGTDQLLRSKIFVYADGRVVLYRERPRSLPARDDAGLQLAEPSVTGDGQIVTCDIQGFCGSTDLCTVGAEVDSATGPMPLMLFGATRVSGNKRYVLTGWKERRPILIDLVAGTQTSAPNDIVVDPSVTDDGSILMRDGSGGLYLWRDRQITRIPTKFVPTSARVNRLRTKAAYEKTYDEYELRVVDLASGNDVQIATAGPAPPLERPTSLIDPATLPLSSYMLPSLTKDGRLIAYRAPDSPVGPLKVFVSNTDGSSRRKLLDEIVGQVAITGFGNYVFASGARLVRISVDSGVVSELIPATPVIGSPPTLSIVPGGNYAVFGFGLDQTIAPHITFDGKPGAVVGANSSQMRFLVPWDASPGTTVQVRIVSDSPFETAIPAQVFASQPQQFGVPVHEDWRYITDLDGVMQGEIVHLSLLNLGAVLPSIPLGSTVPVGTLYRTADPLRCDVESGTGVFPAEVLFSGLMPLTNDNRYQVDVRMPPISRPTATIRCGGVPVAVVFVSQ